VAGAGAEVDQPVGMGHDRLVVLNHWASLWRPGCLVLTAGAGNHPHGHPDLAG
jgi:hypothetical protein